MQYNIIFCTDGILRFKYLDNPMIPADFIYKSYEYKSEFHFWAKWWDEYVIFEEGLTVRQFLSCLEPWSDFFRVFTGKNIQSFIDESKKPTLVKEPEEHELTWISISYNSEIAPSVEYENIENALGDTIDFNKWLNTPQKSRLTGQWDINGSYKLTGYSEGYTEQYSIDHSPMNELANLPLVLIDSHIVMIENHTAQRMLGQDYQFFSDNAYGIRKVKTGSGFELTYIEGKKYHRFKELIEGFFWWFPSDPVKREAFNQSLRDSINNIDKEIDEKLEEDTSNVIPLFQEDNDSDKKAEDKKLKVVVSDGAFDSLIAHHDKQKSFWEKTLEIAKQDDNVILKIGAVKEAIAPEARVYAHIVENKDLKTEYKL